LTGLGWDAAANHVPTLKFGSGERYEAFHRPEPDRGGEKAHDLDAFDEGAISLRLTLRDDAPQREDALASELDGPALRPLVLGPRLARASSAPHRARNTWRAGRGWSASDRAA
jgi:hypothetical protein